MTPFQEAEKVQGYIAGVVTTADFNFYYSLILAALCREAPAESREALQSPHAAKPGPDEDMGGQLSRKLPSPFFTNRSRNGAA